MRSIAVFIFTALLLSCSSQSVKNEIKESGKISKLKKTGILFRLPYSPTVAKAEVEKNLMHWFGGYKMINQMKILASAKDELSYYNDNSDRFYQVSESRAFLPYKSMGSVLLFCEKNRTDLEALMKDNDLDSIIIYEVDSDYSMELQFYGYELMVTILDRKLDIIYMDHSSKNYNIDEFDPERGKTMMMDNVSNRFITTLLEIDFIKKK